MDDKPVISVIIPLYNGGKKILTCLERLDRQTFTKAYEVIIVDDMSTDESVRIVENEIAVYERKSIFKLIKCKENGRAGRARNLGVKEASGEYILFIDQDDYPDFCMLEKMYCLTQNGTIDCVSCGILEKDGREYFRPKVNCRMDTNEVWKVSLSKKFGYVFGNLYRRKILIDNQIMFPEHVMFEDVLYNFWIVSCIESYEQTNEILYFRLGDQNSQTAFFTPKKLEDRIKATSYYFEKIFMLNRSDEFRKECEIAAFYYIYLSCTLWMIEYRGLYKKQIFKDSLRKGREIPIKWMYIYEYDFLRKPQIKMLEIIYYIPVTFYLFHIIELCKIVLRKMRKILKNMNGGG